MENSKRVLSVSGMTEAASSTIRFGADASGERFVEITRDGQTAVLPVIDLVLPPRALARKLANSGIVITGPQNLAKLHAEIDSTDHQVTFRVARLPGWQSPGSYLHGDRLVGHRPHDLVVDRSAILLGDRPGKFAVSGCLADWQADVRMYAADQPLLTFLLASAFAAMALRLLKIQPFVINLWGPSSVGKSSAARFAGSVYGGDPQRPQLGFAESFKTTDAGLEKLALSHNDSLLILDEFGRVQGSPRERVRIFEAAVKDLCSGAPKTKAIDATGGLSWSTVGIITSNESYSTLLRKAGLQADEALGPRLIELKADLGTQLGVFKTMPPDSSDSRSAVKDMQASTGRNFGTAIVAFAEALIKEDAIDAPALYSRVERLKSRFAIWAGEGGDTSDNIYKKNALPFLR